MKKFCLIFYLLFVPLSSFSLGILEKIQAQVGDKIISLIDTNNFKKQLKEGLIPSSFLLDTLYKNPSSLLKNSSKHLNYLIARELVNQSMPEESLNSVDVNELEQNLKKIQGKSSQTLFLKTLKRSGIPSLNTYREFLKQEQQINLYLIKLLMPKVSLSDQEIESVFFKKYKRSIFTHFEYEFLSVSFNEEKKDLVLKNFNRNISDLEKLAQTLKLSSKISKLKANEIESSIKKELDKLSISQISPLLFLNSSYYILQLRWKTPLLAPKDISKKNQIEKELTQMKLKKELEQWIQNLKEQVFVKKNSH